MSNEDNDTQELNIDPSRLTALTTLLLNLSIADPLCETIIVKFSGGGDEGSIEDITAEPTSKAAEEIIADDEVNELMNGILSEDSNHDWWNNEGGHGEMTINIKTRVIDLDMYLYVQSSEHYPMRTTL